MPSARPGVVLKSKFIMPGTNEFKKYVEYIDRDDAKLEVNVNRESKNLTDFELFHAYVDYMGDEKKEGSLFTEDIDELNFKQKSEIKNLFSIAQNNGSPMWQDVISFDNQWLEKQGLYNTKTKELDEIKMRNVVRLAVKEMLKAEKMEDSAIWTAAIHYNTDNIHVHIATVEPFPTREKKMFYDKKTKEWREQFRAKRKQGALDKMKSKIANTILDRTEQRNKIDEIIRGSVHKKKEGQLDLSAYRKTKKLFMKAINNLPEDRRQWYYGYQTINDARPFIDEIVKIYLDTFHKEEMQELEKLLDEEVQIMKEMYGEGSNYERYKQTKMDDLKKRMGNAVLTEMRTYVKRKEISYKKGKSNHFPISIHDTWKQKGDLVRAINHLNYRLRKTFHDYKKEKNLEEFDRMLEGYEQ